MGCVLFAPLNNLHDNIMTTQKTKSPVTKTIIYYLPSIFTIFIAGARPSPDAPLWSVAVAHRK